MSPSIHILTIQIDTKSLEINLLCKTHKTEFFPYVRLIDVVRL